MPTSTSTIVFTDVVGSTVLRAGLGEDAADRVFRDHERALGEVVASQRGRVVKTGGDGVMAAFESATDAVRAAVAIQQRIARDFYDLHVRVGVATGDVSWEDGDCFGMPVVTAARLQARADGDQIVASALVRLLAGDRAGVGFRPLGSLELAGLNDPIEAYEVEWSPLDEDGDGGFRVPLPGALGVAPSFGFVGRDSEWRELVTAWDASAHGAGRIVLVGGEAGAGKTRLAFEFARHCATEGATVVLGVCDAELALPYQPWVQVLDQLVRAMSPDLTTVLSDELAELTVLLPQLERLVPGLRRAPAADPQTERYRLFQAAATLLATVASHRAMLVIIDDLHWADAQTLALLRHVARATASSPLLVVGTFRDTGDEITDPLAGCLADLRRASTCSRVRLAGLDRASVERFVAGAVGHDLDPGLRRLSAMLAERSGGNAFYVSELWRHMVANELVVRTDGLWSVGADADTAGVPDSVREVVADRLARLSAPARALLELTAVAGLRAEFRVLAAASGSTIDDLDATLDELLQAKFLVEIQGLSSSSYEFVHAIVRETVERTVSSSARTRLHQRLAEAIETVHEADRRPVLADLARHYVAAARLGHEGKALYYSRRAAAQALRSGAYDAAIDHLRAARELAADPEEATDITLDLGEAHSRAGDIRGATKEYAEAFSAARRAGRVEQVGRAALGFAEAQSISGVHSQPSVDITRAALVLLGLEVSPLRIRLQASLARALWLAGHAEEAIRTAGEAVDAARRHGDDRIVLFALQCLQHTAEPEPHLYARVAREGYELAFSLGDMWSFCYSRHSSVRGMMNFGRLADAAVAARDLAQVAERERFAIYQYYSVCHDVLFALFAGRFAEAERLAEAAHSLGSSIGAESAAGVYGVHMFAIRREQGRLGEVAPVLRMAARLQSDQPIWRPGLAALCAEVGMLDEARLEFEAMAPDGFASVPRDSMWPCCLTFLAEVCVALGDVEHAHALYVELEPFRGLAMNAAFTVNFGPAERLMGALAALLGRRADAERHFWAALELAEQSGSPVWRARVQHDWAVALGDRRDLLAAAHATAVELGMATLAERTSPAVVEAPTSPPLLLDGLSSREVEVLALVAEGRSNREIGKQLYISPNTVANHVRAILQKTGCANRTEAASYAAQRGLANGHRPHLPGADGQT